MLSIFPFNNFHSNSIWLFARHFCSKQRLTSNFEVTKLKQNWCIVLHTLSYFDIIQSLNKIFSQLSGIWCKFLIILNYFILNENIFTSFHKILLVWNSKDHRIYCGNPTDSFFPLWWLAIFPPSYSSSVQWMAPGFTLWSVSNGQTSTISLFQFLLNSQNIRHCDHCIVILCSRQYLRASCKHSHRCS